MKHEWEVIVGNIGTVYSGTNGFEARKKFSTYVKQSKTGYGRAAYEDVTLMKDGDMVKEHYGQEPKHNPALGSWVPTHAVRFNKDGSVSLLTERESNPARKRVTKKRRASNPFEAGLNRKWYLRGRVAGKSQKFADMVVAWQKSKGKPTIPGKRVTAQESFYQGYMDGKSNYIYGS